LKEPDSAFFKRYGESMPKGDWNHPGTKQGIYMMGPDAEYLEGKFAAGGEYDNIRGRLARAVERWEALRKQKGYANKPVPARKWSPPPGVDGELILRVNIRDLPRGPGDKSGARFENLTKDPRNFEDYLRWAWNENWIGFRNHNAFVPTGNSWQAVEESIVKRIAMETMVDNVRGQAPTWQAHEVKTANLQMRRQGSIDGAENIEYMGEMRMRAGPRSYAVKLYGRGEYERAKRSFRRLDLVAAGLRSGAAQFNRRERDPGPAPMGVTLSLSRE
jgi:hypothetical protein